MVGYGSNKGIVPMAFDAMFKKIASNTDPSIKYQVTLSMLEIYMEQVLSRKPDAACRGVFSGSRTSNVMLRSRTCSRQSPTASRSARIRKRDASLWPASQLTPCPRKLLDTHCAATPSALGTGTALSRSVPHFLR